MRKQCDNCCIWDKSCESCKKCLPMFLCVHVGIVPGPTVYDACCHYDFLMPYECEHKWAGAGACGGYGNPVASSLQVELITSGTSCYTQITGTFIDYPIVFEGVVPEDMEFSVTTPNGDILTYLIQRANVVPNPVADVECSPCACASCLPGRICLSLTGPVFDNDYGEPLAVPCNCVTITNAEWNCSDRAWESQPLTCFNRTINVSLKLMNENSGACGIHILIDDEYFDHTDDVILFEPPMPTTLVGGAKCIGNGLSTVLGKPQILPCPEGEPDCPQSDTQIYTTLINKTYDIGGGFFLTISANVCGSCNEGIKTFCCGCTPLPQTVTLEVISSCALVNGFTLQLSWDNCDKSWKAYHNPPCVEIIRLWRLTCLGTAFNLSVSAINGATIYDIHAPDIADCEPFSLEWTNQQHTNQLFANCLGAPPLCAPASDTYNILITA